MEQRPLRLGDIVDDYCPRERRITNHAIVAVVGQSIRQTRCTTCDAEHVYKDAKVPRRRKKDEPDALYDEVLSEVTAGQLVPKQEPQPAESVPAMQASASASNPPEKTSPPAATPSATTADTPPDESPVSDNRDHWPGHRTLIRAQLPRVEGGEPPPRPIPEFTMHQRQGRSNGGFRYGQGWGHGGGSNGGGNGNVNGNTANGHGRHGGFRSGRPGGGPGQGQGAGPGGGGGRHRHRGGKHRQPK